MARLNTIGIQFDIAWENPVENYTRLDEHLSGIKDVDLIVLPEMFTTGFSMEPERIAETYHHDMPTLQWMRKHAAQKNTVILGSISCRENDRFFNRCLIVFPEGNHLYYDKVHLFSMGHESHHYSPGDRTLIFEWKGWKIKPLICYDLRFPEHARNEVTENEVAYDLLVYSANWPEVRTHPWSVLLRARAIENQCFLLGINRVGKDDQGISHSGASVILDAKGETIISLSDHEEGILRASLNREDLDDFREKFPVLKDKRQ